MRNVTLQIDHGEFAGIFGPLGSGKSTLLHILGGLARPDKGYVFINGINLSFLSDSRLAEIQLRKIGFVFQFFNLLPRLTALGNVELPLTLADVPERESARKAKGMLELVGLKDHIDHRPCELG